MSKGDVIFLRSNGSLQAFSRSDYTSEDLLQRLLADHPDLLSGEQLRPGDPIRWLFVAREAGVPDGETAGDRWSLDHLFLNHDAIPTLEEQKRSSACAFVRDQTIPGFRISELRSPIIWNQRKAMCLDCSR